MEKTLKWEDPYLRKIDNPKFWEVIKLAVDNDFGVTQLKGLLIAFAMQLGNGGNSL